MGSDGSRWSIQQAGRTALELARGEAAHLELDLRTIPGVRVTAYDAGKGYQRIDLRRCPVPFRHLAFKWIESLYGTPCEPVRSSLVKNPGQMPVAGRIRRPMPRWGYHHDPRP